MRNPLCFRFKLLLKHTLRIAFLPWPKYTFNDLATAQDALDGPRFQKMSRILKKSCSGRRLLSEKPGLNVSNVDWNYLAGLPTNSFGYCVWHHFISNDILNEPDLGTSPFFWGKDAEYTKDRFRQTHDFRHVLLGLGITGREEVLVNIFQASQFFLFLSALIGFAGTLKHGWYQPIRMLGDILKSIREGKKCQVLIDVRFEVLWERDINELRTEFNLKPVGDHYPPVFRHPKAKPLLEANLTTA